MNANIKPLPYEPKRPVTVGREHPDYLIIEGVRYSGDVFRTLAFPDPDRLYFFQRDGETVVVTVVMNVEGAKNFFESLGG